MEGSIYKITALKRGIHIFMIVEPIQHKRECKKGIKENAIKDWILQIPCQANWQE